MHQIDIDPSLTSRHTQRQYKTILAAFEGWRGQRDLTRSLVTEYAAELQAAGRAPSTINQRLAAIRWWARKVGDLAQDASNVDQDEKDRIEKLALRVASVADVKGSRPEKGRHISTGELSALLDACIVDHTPAGARDAALISMAWAIGARREELASIDLKDMTPNNTGEMLDIVLHGKGDKPRKVFINDGALAFLHDWLAVRGDQPGVIFCTINKGGIITGGDLSGEALRLILAKRCHEARIAQPMTWHDFRRSFAGNLWQAGIDGVVIQKLMGHTSQDQTAKYDRRPEDTRREAIKVLHVPYRQRELINK